MKRIDEHTVELTEAEMVVKELYDFLTGPYGMEPKAAVKGIEDSVPQNGSTMAVLNTEGFRDYLMDDTEYRGCPACHWAQDKVSPPNWLMTQADMPQRKVVSTYVVNKDVDATTAYKLECGHNTIDF